MSGIDVLAVMEAMAIWGRLRADPEWSKKADAARAAVAELIESGNRVASHGSRSATQVDADWDRFRMAIRRVKGGE